MGYSELLTKYIEESKLSLSEISRKMFEEQNVKIDKSYISKLKNGNANPPSDEVSMALAKVTNGDPEALVLAGIYEKAPEELKLMKIWKLKNFDKLLKFLFDSDDGSNNINISVDIDKIDDDDLKEQIIFLSKIPSDSVKGFISEAINDAIDNRPLEFLDMYKSSPLFDNAEYDKETVFKLKKLRTSKNISTQEAAELLDISEDLYIKIENYGGLLDNNSAEELSNAYKNAINIIQDYEKRPTQEDNDIQRINDLISRIPKNDLSDLEILLKKFVKD